MKPSPTKSRKTPKKRSVGRAGPLGPPRLTGGARTQQSVPSDLASHSSSPNFQASFRESLLDLLWQQWAVLGVAGHAGKAPDWIVDIEALILVTTTQGRMEPRLFDEMLDWLWTNAHWVNVQRLRNIRKRLSLGDARTLAAVADWLSQRTTLSKWKPLAAITPDQPAQPERFYLTKAGLAQPMVGPSDPTFLRHGFVLPPIERRELSRPPNPRNPAALSGKLRSLFGVQARCEILLWLLTHESGRPAEIARATFYFPRTVEDTLRELAGSGLVHTAQTGREKRYWLKSDDWRFLRSWKMPDRFPRWFDWPRFFSAQEKVLSVLANASLSPLLQASELRREFEDLAPVLKDGELLSAFAASRNHPGTEFTAALFRDLETLFARL